MMFLKALSNIRSHANHIHIGNPTNTSSINTVYPRISAPLKCGSRIPDLKNDLRIIMGLESVYNSNLFQDRENLNTYHVKNRLELPPRSIKDSFLTGILPFKTDQNLQDWYSSNSGELRNGRLIEDIDLFAVMVLQKYILNPKIPISEPSPYTIVTVMVDSLIFNFQPKPIADLRISGHISNVGRYSAEVIVWLDQQSGEHWRNITNAKLVMAIRDANNKEAAYINPLIPASPEENSLVGEAKRYRSRFQPRTLFSLTNDIPNPQEQKLLHKLALKTCNGFLSCEEHLPTGNRWISNTLVSNSVVTFPEHRNVHNTIFGGYIMRHAIELAFVTCYLFCRQQGKLRGLSEVKLYRSIPAGSVLKLYGQVAYTNMRFIQVALHAQMQNNRDGLQQATNTFLATFEVSHPVQDVYPKTYRESMLYIDAGRKLDQIIKSINEPFYHIDYNFHKTFE